jgi:hypothetical protein
MISSGKDLFRRGVAKKKILNRRASFFPFSIRRDCSIQTGNLDFVLGMFLYRPCRKRTGATQVQTHLRLWLRSGRFGNYTEREPGIFLESAAWRWLMR